MGMGARSRTARHRGRKGRSIAANERSRDPALRWTTEVAAPSGVQDAMLRPGLLNAHPPSMSIRLFAPVLMALGIVGMTVAVIWWYDYYIELKELLGARTPPPLECLYKIIQPCRFADAVPAWEGGVRPYRPELLWIAALSFMIGSGMEFVQVVRRELEAPDQKPTRDIS